MEAAAQGAGQGHPQGLPKIKRPVEAAAHGELAGGIGQAGIRGLSQMGQILLVGKNTDITAVGCEVRGITGTNQQTPVILFPVGKRLAQQFAGGLIAVGHVGVFIGSYQRRCHDTERTAQQCTADQRHGPEGFPACQQNKGQYHRRKKQQPQDHGQGPGPLTGVIHHILQRHRGIQLLAGGVLRQGHGAGQAGILRRSHNPFTDPNSHGLLGILVRRAHVIKMKTYGFILGGCIRVGENDGREGIVPNLKAANMPLNDQFTVLIDNFGYHLPCGKGIIVIGQINAHAIQRLARPQRGSLNKAAVRRNFQRLAVGIVDDLVDRLTVHPLGQIISGPGKNQGGDGRQKHPCQKQAPAHQKSFEFLQRSFVLSCHGFLPAQGHERVVTYRFYYIPKTGKAQPGLNTKSRALPGKAPAGRGLARGGYLLKRSRRFLKKPLRFS